MNTATKLMMNHPMMLLDAEARHLRRSSRELARRAAGMTDLSMKDMDMDRAAAALYNARACEAALKMITERKGH